MNIKIFGMLLSAAISMLNVDTLCSLAAKIVAKLLAYASKKGGKAWDITKKAITKINVWTSLYLQVYEDDNLSEEDEKLIAEAIKKETDIEKIVDILKQKAADCQKLPANS